MVRADPGDIVVDDTRSAAAVEPDSPSVRGVITSDALHVHRDNIQQRTDRGGDYILTVKGNMPSLERDMTRPSCLPGLNWTIHLTL